MTEYIEIENALGNWKLPKAFCLQSVGGTWPGSKPAGVIGLLSNSRHLSEGRKVNPVVRAMVDFAGLTLESSQNVPVALLDVGSHVGSYSVFWSKIMSVMKFQHKIIAIEAGKQLIPCIDYNLRKNLDQHCVESRCINAAVTNHENCGKLLKFPMFSTSGETLPGQFGLGDSAENYCEVPGMALDNFAIGQCHILKIDCEGHDFEVIDGASSTFLVNHRPFILFEVSEESNHHLTDFANLLAKNEYLMTPNPYWPFM